MIIVLNEEQAYKPKFKKCKKIIVSESLKEVDDESVQVTTLLPPFKLFSEYINGEISEKKYAKNYIKYIRTNPQLFSVLVSTILGYREHGVLCFVCSAEELTFKYMDILLEYISERYGIPVLDYRKFKKKYESVKEIKREMTKEGMKQLMKDFNEIRSILMGVEDDEEYKRKSKKKKDKKKNKTKNEVNTNAHFNPTPVRRIVVKKLSS